MCIDIIEICFRDANGKILSIFDIVCPGYDSGGVLSFHILFEMIKESFQRSIMYRVLTVVLFYRNIFCALEYNLITDLAFLSVFIETSDNKSIWRKGEIFEYYVH